MELVAWILINQYDCILKGGFVRDYIVGGYTIVPVQNIFKGCTILNDDIVPKDLDILLPITSGMKPFILEEF